MGTAIVNPAGCTLSIDTIQSTDETNAGSKDGTVTVTISGGIPPYTYNWSIDTIISTNTVSMINNLAPGNYSVIVTDSVGCMRNAGPANVADGPLGIKPFEGLTNKILVYPNPATNELNIITSFDEQVVFAIYDIVGKQLMRVKIESEATRVNTAKLTEGIYIYQILNKQDVMLNRGKFSISK